MAAGDADNGLGPSRVVVTEDAFLEVRGRTIRCDPARVDKLAKSAALKAVRPRGHCGFDPRPGHCARAVRRAVDATRYPVSGRVRGYAVSRNFWSPAAFQFVREPSLRLGSLCPHPRRRRRPRPWPDAPAAPPVRRATRRADASRQPGGVRGAGRPLPVAAPGVLPPHAVLARGRRGRAAGGLRGGVQRDDRRRAAAQRAAVAVPDRAQPLAEPPAPRAGDRRRLDGRAPLRARHDDGRQGAQARGVPPAHGGRPGAAGDPADRAAPARDRRAVLRADRRGDGDHGPVDQVAARARARVARRGGRGAAAHLRGGPRGARRGRRGPEAHDRAGPPPPAHVRALRRLPQVAARDEQGARLGHAGRPPAPAQEAPARQPRHDRERRRRGRRGGGAPRGPARRGGRGGGGGAGGAVSASMSVVASKAAATVAAAAIVTVGTVEVDQVREHRHATTRAAATRTHVARPAPPVVVASEPQPDVRPAITHHAVTVTRHHQPAVTEKASSTPKAATKKPKKTDATDHGNGGTSTPADTTTTAAAAGGAASAGTASPQQGSDPSTLPAQQPGSSSTGGVVAPAEPAAPAPTTTAAAPP